MVVVECEDTSCRFNYTRRDNINNRDRHFCGAAEIRLKQEDNLAEWGTFNKCVTYDAKKEAKW